MKQFFKSIDFIERNLSEKLIVHDIAEAACYSPFHFCRMFKALVGESVMEYVRKRRLSIAAERLTKEDVRLIDLALDSQFESHEAFTRAFKKMFRMSPTEYRHMTSPIKLRLREKFDLRTLTHLQKGITMKPKFVEKEGFKVVGLEEDFNDETKQNIPKLWDMFSKKMGNIPNRKGSISYGLCISHNINEGDFSYMAGVEVDSLKDIPKGMVGKTVSKQRYAVFTMKLQGDIHEDIQKTWKYIMGTWLPKSGYEYAGTPDFELYDERFDGRTMTGEFDIYVPIKECN